MNKSILIAFLLFLSWKSKTATHKAYELKAEVKAYKQLLPFQTIQVNRFKVNIINPKDTPLYNLVILPGWNFEKEKWCNESDLCKKANKAGFRLIMPEMGKSIYASQYFKETWPLIKQTAQIQWVTDTLFKYLQDTFGVMLPTQKNYIMGLSTGAHGTALIVERCPTLFKACAVLSGDYDQTKLKQDKIFQATYGLYKNLKEKHPSQNVKLSLKRNQKHDFIYWASEVDSILAFFIQNHQ
ncbi:MAG: hypothetical protein HYZ42_04595 [Bacteroidetes bacterium]|nr:hypothetical protein [Bacteroidota bacterium]